METVTFELRSKERVKVNEFKVRRMVSEAQGVTHAKAMC